MQWSPSFKCQSVPSGEHAMSSATSWSMSSSSSWSARARPNTVRAYAHDLCVFFSVVTQGPG